MDTAAIQASGHMAELRAQRRAEIRIKRRARYLRRTYWTRRWANVDEGLKARLYNLRACESTHDYQASNGGKYLGAYQYDALTWSEAQSYAGVPGRRRTYTADQAPPRMQDVVTARFFPAHSYRWECQA